MQPLRLVKLIPFFTERFGGSVAVAQLMCRELARRGHQVTVVTSDLGVPQSALPAGQAAEETERDGYRVFFAKTRWWQRAPPYQPPAAMGKALRATLATADVLCMNVGLSLVGALGRRAARAARVPYVYNAEGALDPTRLRVKRVAKQVFLRAYERRVLRDAAAVQALTQADARAAVAQGADPDKIAIIPNGIDADAFATPSDGTAFRATHGVPTSAVLILFLGRLHPLKGIDLALEAAAPVMRERAEVWFVVAGPDDGTRPALVRLASARGIGARTVFCGSVPRAGVRDALAAADVFALTSRSEGLSMAALEAAAAGVPLWLTEQCQLPEVAEYAAGTVDPPDADTLAASLRALLESPHRRAECGRNAVRMVRERFSLRSVVDRLEALYFSVRDANVRARAPRSSASAAGDDGTRAATRRE